MEKKKFFRICHEAHNGGGLKNIEIFAVPLRAAQCFVIIGNKYIRAGVTRTNHKLRCFSI